MTYNKRKKLHSLSSSCYICCKSKNFLRKSALNFGDWRKVCIFADRNGNYGLMAEWLGRGLQNLVQRFESASDLHLYLINPYKSMIYEGLFLSYTQIYTHFFGLLGLLVKIVDKIGAFFTYWSKIVDKWGKFAPFITSI